MTAGRRARSGSLAAAAALAVALAAGCSGSTGPALQRGGPPFDDAPGTRPLWATDYRHADLREFRRTPWNDSPDRPTVVARPAVGGPGAGRYVVPAGGSRCESVPRLPSFQDGDVLWFSWFTMLGPGVPLDTAQWQVVVQWKNSGIGSPPLAVEVVDGQYVLAGGYGWPGDTTRVRPRPGQRGLGPAHRNRWTRFDVRVVFSSDPAVGSVDLWRDLRPVVRHWHPPGGTLYPGLDSYLKIGYYRSRAIASGGTVFHDRVRVGRTASSVR